MPHNHLPFFGIFGMLPNRFMNADSIAASDIMPLNAIPSRPLLARLANARSFPQNTPVLLVKQESNHFGIAGAAEGYLAVDVTKSNNHDPPGFRRPEAFDPLRLGIVEIFLSDIP